jgi:hypothetical protein
MIPEGFDAPGGFGFTMTGKPQRRFKPRKAR